MLNTVKPTVREGSIELLEEADILEGAEVLVTILADETEFWRHGERVVVSLGLG